MGNIKKVYAWYRELLRVGYSRQDAADMAGKLAQELTWERFKECVDADDIDAHLIGLQYQIQKGDDDED